MCDYEYLACSKLISDVLDSIYCLYFIKLHNVSVCFSMFQYSVYFNLYNVIHKNSI